MTEPYYRDESVTLHAGDCLDVLRELPDASVDAVVTDPPYNLSFMGREWDSHVSSAAFGAWCLEWSLECLRILKPGGHMLAFGGTRTWHRLACATEDAGFDIRDSVADLCGAPAPGLIWNYASGFPKSLSAGAAVMKMQGLDPLTDEWTPEAEAWRGHGTALKPAWEPIVVARKPLQGTVASNVQQHGTGALNIDACRVQPTDRAAYEAKCASVVGLDSNRNGSAYGEWTGERQDSASPAGRWPANLVLTHSCQCAPNGSPDGGLWVCVDGCPVRELDRQSGSVQGAVSNGKRAGTGYAEGFGIQSQTASYADSGGASRFFPTFRYEPKAPTSERPSFWTHSCDCEDAWPTATPPLARVTAATTEPGNSSTSRYGSSATDSESPTVTTSTTATATSSTTIPPTSSCSTNSHTSGSTRGANSATASGGSPAVSALCSSPSPMSTGTSPARDGSLTTAVGPAMLREWSATSVCGNCAAPSRREAHATVKPLDLMRWLVRLVTPPGGTALDPFAGSGTTGEACVLEGFDCILIEREPTYLPLIVQRLTKPLQPDLFGGAA